MILEGLIWRVSHSEDWSLNDCNLKKNMDSKAEANAMWPFLFVQPVVSPHVWYQSNVAGIPLMNRGDTQAITQIDGQFPRPRSSSAKQYSGQISWHLLARKKVLSHWCNSREKLLESEYEHRQTQVYCHPGVYQTPPCFAAGFPVSQWLAWALLRFIQGPPLGKFQPDKNI